MDSANLRIETRGPAVLITIDRAKMLNALDPVTLQELTAAVQDLASKPGLVGVVIQGAGEKAFVAGADIAAMAHMGPLEAQRHSETGHALVKALRSSPLVSVAAVKGYALGGGLELALACDFRIASEDAQFGAPEVGLGVIPGFGGTQLLPRLLGEARAKELLLTGDRIDASRALSLGMVHRVVPKDRVLDESLALVARIAKNGPLAVRVAKDVAQQGLELPLEHGLALEARAFGTVFASRDQKEGMKAFLEKRPPRYEGC